MPINAKQSVQAHEKIHFIIELALMSMSALMMIILIASKQAAIIYFLVWQGILVSLQFIHALVLTWYFKKDISIWSALRTYWLLIAVFFTGLVLRKEPWFSNQLYTFIIFVLPWFAAIYFTLITYRFRLSKEEVINKPE